MKYLTILIVLCSILTSCSKEKVHDINLAYVGTWVEKFDSMEDFTIWLNWVRVWRKFSKEGHLEAQRLLDQLKGKYLGEHTFLYVGEAWQLSQRLSMNLSQKCTTDVMDPWMSDVFQVNQRW